MNYWQIREQFNSTKATKVWLYKVVRNKCLDVLKTEKKKGARYLTLELLTVEAPPNLSDLEIEEIQQKINLAFKKMPELTLKIFMMSRHNEKTYAEIANELDISVKTVEYHISKALTIMRVHLKDYLYLLPLYLYL